MGRAFGNFQFMPSTIENNAIDYNNDNLIDLKSPDDSFASAANYLSKMGWDKNGKCYKEIELDEKIPLKFLNYSARKIKYKKKLSFYKKYIKNYNNGFGKDEEIVAIITPDKEIVENSNLFSPAYIIYDNYEIILKWNRSLRFALAVCTLKDKFNDDYKFFNFYILINCFLRKSKFKKTSDPIIHQNYSNKGFTLVYTDELYKNKTVNKKLNDRVFVLQKS